MLASLSKYIATTRLSNRVCAKFVPLMGDNLIHNNIMHNQQSAVKSA